MVRAEGEEQGEGTKEEEPRPVNHTEGTQRTNQLGRPQASDASCNWGRK